MLLEYKRKAIYYDVTGKGPALVLLHGFLETSAMWRDFIPLLSKKNRVICIDLLGHGQTDSINYCHCMSEMATAVLAVLDHLNINTIKCVGHSMGGYVALALAHKKPEIFEGLCLMNSTFEADTPLRKQLRKRAIKMAHHNYKNLVRLSFSNLFSPSSRMRYKIPFDKALNTALQTTLQGYLAAQEGMLRRSNRLDVFKQLSGKKYVITGKKDTLIDSEKIKKSIVGTMITHVELSEGHMSHIENKEDLSDIILHFIEK